MNIPRSLRIGGIRWRVKFDDNLNEVNNANGICDRKNCIIFIDSSLSRQQAEVTLLHEILHAICWQSGILEQIDCDAEEKVVNALAYPLHQVLLENKLL